MTSRNVLLCDCTYMYIYIVGGKGLVWYMCDICYLSTDPDFYFGTDIKRSKESLFRKVQSESDKWAKEIVLICKREKSGISLTFDILTY